MEKYEMEEIVLVTQPKNSRILCEIRGPFQYCIRCLSYSRILLQAARFVFRIVWPLWNLANELAALLTRHLCSFKVIWWLNSLRAKFFREKINIYLHFMSLLNIDMTQVPKILSPITPGPTYSTQSISLLLMSWRRKEPGHQHPWYWPS